MWDCDAGDLRAAGGWGRQDFPCCHPTGSAWAERLGCPGQGQHPTAEHGSLLLGARNVQLGVESVRKVPGWPGAQSGAGKGARCGSARCTASAEVLGCCSPFIPGDAPGFVPGDAPGFVPSGCACSSAPAPSSPTGCLCLGVSLRGTPGETAVQGAGRAGDGGGAAEERKEGKVLCEAVLDVLGLRSPSEVSGTGQGAHTRVAQSLCPQGCRDPFPSCPKGSYLTERENSPGALSLSRIRKAPR